MPRNIGHKLVRKIRENLKKTDIYSPTEKMNAWLAYLDSLREHFFYSNEQRPTEYYTFDYDGIENVTDGFDGGDFAPAFASDEEYKDIQEAWNTFYNGWKRDFQKSSRAWKNARDAGKNKKKLRRKKQKHKRFSRKHKRFSRKQRKRTRRNK